MGTTSVGIRELKRDAAKLVQQAADGQRVVVTRYGRPRAVLVAVEAPQRAVVDSFDIERAAFERAEPALRRRFLGQWVATREGRVVARGSDPQRLARRMLSTTVRLPFYIGRVGAPLPMIEMPGFEIA